MSDIKNPVVLCILDGWGVRDDADDNAITRAHTPVMDQLVSDYPHSILRTSGRDVGLPTGQMGNSEVGHMSIGSGRIVMQDLPRIDQAISDGSLISNKVFQTLVSKLKETGGTCHLMGLVSDGGVHAHMAHVIALAKALSSEGIPVAIHAFLDGRDTPPTSAKLFMNDLLEAIIDDKHISVATITGRYYAMDRDERWERIQTAYDAIISGTGHVFDTVDEAIESYYQDDVSDEFIPATVIGDYEGAQPSDAILMANFRSDRAREMTQALLDPTFNVFDSERIDFCYAVGMTEYSEEHNEWLETLFEAQILEDMLGQVIADHQLKQLRIAETEKYAHVTFFLNGGREALFDGEKRILVASPMVATYDLQPEMSAVEVTDKLVDAIHSEEFDLIVVNYANTDMVGHTGQQDAVQKAVEAVDACIGRVSDAVKKQEGVLVITADHGNAEKMYDEQTGQPFTAHTTGPVPLVIVGTVAKNVTMLSDGRLSDVAPTILDLMNIEKPTVMTGDSLITWTQMNVKHA